MRICPRCGEENPERAHFCLACAAPLREELGKAAGERRRVAVLFADLVGFTAMSETRDPEELRALIDPGMDRLGAIVTGYGGSVDKVMGDALMAIFGAPVAHEDDSERAVRAALEIQRVAAAEPALFAGLRLRIGVNTGEVIFAPVGPGSRRDFTVMGDAVNVASRLQALAPPGGVAAGEPTYARTQHAIEYAALGDVEVKGKSAPVGVWQALAPRDHVRGGGGEPATPFVGRGLELSMLERLYVRACERSSIELVTIVGEPGAGKSRLVRELRAALGAAGGPLRWRQGHCLPYGEGITFSALTQVLQSELGIVPSDPREAAAAKLSAGTSALFPAAGEAASVAARLAPLVGAAVEGGGATGERADAFAGWSRFLEAVARRSPVVLVIEDLHWADPALLEFLEHLVRNLADAPILLLCTARPEVFDRGAEWGHATARATTLSLAPLIEREVEQLIAALLPGVELGDATRAALLERAGGNPLYTEEFARLVGALSSEPGEIEAPETVQALIAARLDGLARDEKELLQAAAVVGDVFSPSVVGVVAGRTEQDVAAGLQALLAKEFVRRLDAAGETEREYGFWHVLVRDVAYEQIPRKVLAARHRAVADWLAAAAGSVRDQPEVVAHHYERTRELARAAGDEAAAEAVREPLRDFLRLAGRRALQLDVAMSESYYRRALDLCGAGEPLRPHLLVEAAEAALVAGRLEVADEWFQQAIADFGRQDDREHEAEAMVRLARARYFQARGDEELELLHRALALVERGPPGPALALAAERMAGYYMLRGHSAECLEWSGRAHALADRLGLEEQRVRALELRGIARCELGDADGIADLEQAVELGIAAGLGEETCRSYGNLGEWVWLTQGPVAGMRIKNEGVEYGDQRGLDLPSRWHVGEGLWTLFDLGDWDEVVRRADDLIAWDEARAGSGVAVMARTWKSRVALERGELGLAQTLADAALPNGRRAHAQVKLPALAAAAVCAAAAGAMPRALELVAEIEEFVRERPAYRARHLLDCVRVCLACGEPDIAARLARECAPLSKRDENVLASAAALLAEAAGEQTAAELFGRAAELWVAYGHPFEEALAHLGRARCLAAESPDAAAAGRAAATALERLGAVGALAAAANPVRGS